MTDFVDIFEQKAIAQDIQFFYGSRGYQNFNLQQAALTDGKKVILLFPASSTPQISDGSWSQYRVTTKIFMGRKFELDTVSSVAETEKQKYDRRLKELTTALDEFLYSTFCGEGIKAISIRYFHDLNQYSANLDMVGADITFDIW